MLRNPRAKSLASSQGEGVQAHNGAGGFKADFTRDWLLARYRPDLRRLPTTNGEHCTDGIEMGEPIGGKTIDLEQVQVHPTGLGKPDGSDAKTNFLAAEARRGVGGLVRDADGKRFTNEFGRRKALAFQALRWT